MPNPFPGMNPYLEAHWRDVHTSMMVYMRDHLQDQLPDDLVARVEESVSIDSGEGRRGVNPDVRVVEEMSGLSLEHSSAPALAVAEPLLIAVDDLATERHVEILDQGDHRVVTAIEVLSPTNKVDADERVRYRKKQREYLRGLVNLVEIDLIRDGEFVLAVPPEKIPPSRRTQYLICVRRACRPLTVEVYDAPLRQRLPAFRVPLRPTDQDASLDLQAIVDLCYQRGRYTAIDYRREPEPPLSEEDARWADGLLREKGLR
ncbi:MAG: DUF4058 family protein [Planctomycetes bacterium]|nr:DUF4058 family protein [Planctomycetota bacterium]